MAKVQRFIWVFQFLFVLLQHVWRKETKTMKNVKGFDIQFDFSGFKKIADLISYDGPLLSHYVSSKGDDYLFYWVDRDANDNRWMVLRVNLASLQKYIAGDVSLLELVGSPNDGYLYLVDVDNNICYHNVKLVQPADHLL